MYKKINLDNGLCIVLNSMPHMESAVIGVWIATGSRNETKDLSGISHFLEHMIFKGTPTMSSRRIKEEIEGRGGSLNGFTSEEATCYLAKVSSRHIDIALGVISDMVLHANMTRRDIERERTVIIEEIKLYRDLPNHHVHDILNEIMWPGHALGLSIAGDIKSVSSITRQDLINHKEASYTSGNITVVLCGRLNQNALIQKIKDIFREDAKTQPATIVEFNNVQSGPQLKVLHKETEQTRLCIGLRTFGRMHKDRYALALLHIILGANMSSRLFENVREKRGLAYEIGTEIKRYKETGAFIVNAGIEHKKASEAIELIIKELKNIKKRPVPGKELKRAKEFFKVQLLLALEDTMDHMLWLGDHVIATGKLPDKAHIIKRVKSVSSSDLQRVAKDIFTSKNINLAMICPLRDSETDKIKEKLGDL